MTTEASPAAGGAVRRVMHATNIYVGIVAAAGVVLTAAAIRLDGIVLDGDLGGAAAPRGAGPVAGFRLRRRGPSQPLVHRHHHARRHGPGGPRRRRGRRAGHGPLPRRCPGCRCARGSSTPACSRSWAWSAVPPTSAPVASPRDSDPAGTWQIMRSIGIPLLMADVVQFAVNLVLIAIVVRLAAGVSMRAQVGRHPGLRRACAPRLRGHRVHHGGPVGAGRPGRRERLPHAAASSRGAVGLPPVRRRGQGARARAPRPRRGGRGEGPAPGRPQQPGGRAERVDGAAPRPACPGRRRRPGRRHAPRPGPDHAARPGWCATPGWSVGPAYAATRYGVRAC